MVSGIQPGRDSRPEKPTGTIEKKAPPENVKISASPGLVKEKFAPSRGKST
jgi:hypothetical protein